ncbi:Uncharacterised protein [uncultured archaeon]|nr:Uncharacterised protein [uncultured archaeon]
MVEQKTNCKNNFDIVKNLPTASRLLYDKVLAEKNGSGQGGALREAAINHAIRTYADHYQCGRSGEPNVEFLKKFDANGEDMVRIKKGAVNELIRELDNQHHEEYGSTGAVKLAKEIGWLPGATKEAAAYLDAFDVKGTPPGIIQRAIGMANAFGLTDAAWRIGNAYLKENETREIDRAAERLKQKPDWYTLNEHYGWLARFARDCGNTLTDDSKEKILPYVADAVVHYCDCRGADGSVGKILKEEFGFDEKEIQSVASDAKAKLIAKMSEHKEEVLTRTFTESIIRFFAEFGTKQELEDAFKLLVNDDADGNYIIMPLLIAEHGMMERLRDLAPKLASCLEHLVANPDMWRRQEANYPKVLKDYMKAGLLDPVKVRNAIIRVIEADLHDGKLGEAAMLAGEFGMPYEAEKISEIQRALERLA